MRIGIDCGANVGNITKAMLASVDTVYAFEPNPYAFDRLSSRFSDDSRVHCYPHAVLDKEGMMDLYFHMFF